MNYRSVNDLNQTIKYGLCKIPKDIDLIIGIPRSGLLAASLISLHSNRKFVGLDSFLANTEVKTGHTRNSLFPTIKNAQDALHILLVDDSSASGNSMKKALTAILNSGYSGKISTCAIYTIAERSEIDISFETVPLPRIFEWNLMHRDFLSHCCVDLDGVLCIDPTNKENDDGNQYLEFIRNTPPLLMPTYTIGRIVTSRLERYRKETVEWLENHNIKYNCLDMLDLPDAETRRRLKAHASFKASIYSSDPNMKLFIESETSQAQEIAKLSGKYALSISTQELFPPGFTPAYIKQATKRWYKKLLSFTQQYFNRH